MANKRELLGLTGGAASWAERDWGRLMVSDAVTVCDPAHRSSGSHRCGSRAEVLQPLFLRDLPQPCL